MSARRKTLDCRICKNSPFGYITENGEVMIVSRHHGQKHVNIITIKELAVLYRELLLEMGSYTGLLDDNLLLDKFN